MLGGLIYSIYLVLNSDILGLAAVLDEFNFTFNNGDFTLLSLIVADCIKSSSWIIGKGFLCWTLDYFEKLSDFPFSPVERLNFFTLFKAGFPFFIFTSFTSVFDFLLISMSLYFYIDFASSDSSSWIRDVSSEEFF